MSMQSEIARADQLKNLARGGETNEPFSRFFQYGLLGLCIILYLTQTIANLSFRWVPDESWYSGPAYSIANGMGFRNPAIGPNDIENHFDAHPPGTAILVSTAFKLFGVSPEAARIGPVLAGLIIILLTYWIAKDFIGNEAALIAAFLVATDNLVVLSSRTVRPEAFTTVAILLSIMSMREFERRDRLVWTFLSGLLLALGTMFHVTLLGYIVSLGVLAIVVGYRRERFGLGGALAYTFGYVIGLVPFTVWILTEPLGVAGFRQEFLSRADGGSLLLRFLDERQRYSDFLGINVVHGHGLDAIPLRLPIVLCFLGATFLLWKLRRTWFYLELALLIPTIFWLIYTVNKTSRYLVLMAPIIALSMAAAVAASKYSRRMHRVCLILVCLVIVMQASANYFLLHSARSANYGLVTTELRSAIPSGEPVYGTITFWMAFHDHPYISYERTEPQVAANRYGVRYFIAGDRVMVNGLPGDMEFYKKLNKGMGEIEAKSKLIRQFHDQYYGDLKVFELSAHEQIGFR